MITPNSKIYIDNIYIYKPRVQFKLCRCWSTILTTNLLQTLSMENIIASSKNVHCSSQYIVNSIIIRPPCNGTYRYNTMNIV